MDFEGMMESAEMESYATVEFAAGPSQQIAKRKRTKRRRIVVSSSSSGGGGDDKQGCVLASSEEEEEEGDRSVYESTVTTATEEEDMAYCLILLARGGGDVGLGDVNREESAIKTERKRKKAVGSRKTAETISAVGVYECKTCDKAFQSFQALGGHRASHHKKPKVAATNDAIPEEVKLVDQIQMVSSTAQSAIQLKPPSSSSSLAAAHNSSKVHQCSICGSAFSSGQALGGHMRRHRGAMINYTNHTAAAGGAAVVESSSSDEAAAVVVERGTSDNHNDFLSSLDLNLPAPGEEDEDHHRRSYHQQFIAGGHVNSNASATASAAALVFLTPPLVGCYF
uniref:C2H2-type domain-containing protein n=1 Tax=Kalanchoe fedtschenkoi TaxID=63787 RepID=A0A7N0RCH3_KALFE